MVGMDPSMSQEILSLAEIPYELAMEAPDLRFQGLRAPVPSLHGTGFSGVGNLILHARMKKAALPTRNEGRHGDADTGLAGRFQSANRADNVQLPPAYPRGGTQRAALDVRADRQSATLQIGWVSATGARKASRPAAIAHILVNR